MDDSFGSLHKALSAIVATRTNSSVCVLHTKWQTVTGSIFSTFLSNLTLRLTGKRVSTNLLRSSVITEFYGSDASSDPALQDSLTSVIRHSPQVAKTIYDRNTSAAKKQKGLKHLAGLLEKGSRVQLQGEGDLV